MSGIFIVFDGPDGSGKTTQFNKFVNWLSQSYNHYTMVREPGGTIVGEQIRRLLLDPNSEISVTSEMLLYMASRAQLVETIIKPSLALNRLVISDRYFFATKAYQGYAGGISLEDIDTVTRIATQNLMPDRAYFIDASTEIANSRLSSKKDRIEQRDYEYKEKVREGYLQMARENPEMIRVINTDNNDIDSVFNIIREDFLQLIKNQ